MMNEVQQCRYIYKKFQNYSIPNTWIVSNFEEQEHITQWL
ncbi:unnamed protein product [Tenebrio molitor]|nr:unnamed protein product [Tenebrio molitor]